ncbi:type III-A CRISPR-associated RAMP protein Csm5 [Nostoc sp. JL33]|uniref:type III-A CRISPR-associated RAMP protein Csm5 n=1 Tax=Nostoc sp. JL33 TaxID=2815396 RepID=UPI0025E806B0|nr:type III-A CRISPR-associated RAMP protein Csm5 [Nostoc sp. JL33]MBN3873708.1 type III-A CRISPR-associated RAMP protein Csm5 [Nostoc sp. JL33]
MVASENILYKPEVYESKRIQITSPILHIGSAVSKLSPFEYVTDSKRVYIPNQEALARAFKEQGRLNEYIRRIENQEDLNSLLEVTFGNDWQTAKDSNGEAIFPKHTSSLRWTEQKITDLRPMIRNGFGQLYIPGSSIKGAIRTAIAYHLLKYEEKYQVAQTNRVSEIERILQERLVTGAKFSDREKKSLAKPLMKSLFSEFILRDGDNPIGKVGDANTDFMRAVHITDTEPLLEIRRRDKQGKYRFFNLPIAAEVIVSSHFSDWKAKYKAPIYTEMVKNVQTQFTISLDKKMLSWFQHTQGMDIPFNNIDDILEICQEFAQDQWDEEHDYWQLVQNNPYAKDINRQPINLDFNTIRDFYEPGNCLYNIRIGWASGMNGTTVNLLFDEELRKDIRDNCSSKSAPSFEAPKSRRVVTISSREIKFVPGWVKFKVLKVC